MASKLRVYRTAVGFHDAYVAAPSQKAALAAWGTDKPLFARGVAELVTDPDLTAEPLARPGEVVKRLRGSEAEQIAALPPDKPKAKKAAGNAAGVGKKAAERKPSRAELDAAERSLDEAEERHAAERADIDARGRALREERNTLERRQRKELEREAGQRDAARARYEAAIRRWQG